jgi:hypothetical protein
MNLLEGAFKRRSNWTVAILPAIARFDLVRVRELEHLDDGIVPRCSKTPSFA